MLPCHMCATLIVKLHCPRTGATNYHAQLVLPDKVWLGSINGMGLRRTCTRCTDRVPFFGQDGFRRAQVLQHPIESYNIQYQVSS